MRAFLTKSKHFWLKLIWRFIPSKIPVGVAELEQFSNEIIDIYKMPNGLSYHHAIATMIMHLEPTQNTVRRHYVARCLLKSMANQVAFQRIQDIKELEKQKGAELLDAEQHTV